MSKEKKCVFGGYVCSDSSPDRINGQIYSIIEAIGLTEKQEKSIKGLIRQVVWDDFSKCVMISKELLEKIRDKEIEGSSKRHRPIVDEL